MLYESKLSSQGLYPSGERERKSRDRVLSSSMTTHYEVRRQGKCAKKVRCTNRGVISDIKPCKDLGKLLLAVLP